MKKQVLLLVFVLLVSNIFAVTAQKTETRSESEISLNIYNIKGQKVKTLVKDKLPAGNHQIVWNGRDEKGKSVSSGIYFYKMKSGNYKETKKMLLLK